MKSNPHPQNYSPISDYGLISDMQSCALVSSSGSIDWCCFPRFDSPAVFARILDRLKGGYFQLSPEGVKRVHRRYVPGTNVLETTFETDTGQAVLTDFMPVHYRDGSERSLETGPGRQRVIRFLKCTAGRVTFRMECFPRFDYGTIQPHCATHSPNTGFAHGGADAVSIYCSTPLEIREEGFVSGGRLASGDRVCASVTYQRRFSYTRAGPDEAEMERYLAETEEFWRKWSSVCTYRGEYRDDVVRSALTLKALTYAPSGGLLAAATTSLPEAVGGPRNWDYRFTWIRDATFALYALAIIGYHEEARAFKEWLAWSTAGRARDLQIMYGLGGERRLVETEIAELEGHRHSRPVRVGNAAYSQFQLDIYGEIMDSAHLYRKFTNEIDPEYWEYLQRVVQFVMDHWTEADEGLWETRRGREPFVFSKVMCWVALDRAIKAALALDLPGDVDLWRRVRTQIRQDVLARGYDAERGAFVQAYGSKALDAANLMLPLVGFIRANDPRMRSTIEAIERELTTPQGYVYRYRYVDDGLGGDEGTFIMCTFWLADNWILLGEVEKARKLFDALRSCANDLGLLSEQISPSSSELLGNFPQAFSHMGLINTAVQLQKATNDKRSPV
jgi:GH15 family glucan-1,4-alpha-glucosidase